MNPKTAAFIKQLARTNFLSRKFIEYYLMEDANDLKRLFFGGDGFGSVVVPNTLSSRVNNKVEWELVWGWIEENVLEGEDEQSAD